DTVTMVINGVTYSTTVQADGSWSVDVAGSDLAADTSFDVIVSSTDTAGNAVNSSTTSTHTVDVGAPTVGITADHATLGSGESTIITFTFSENIVGFNAADIIVTGGVLSGLTQDPNNPNVWTATFVASGAAAISISVANGAYTDTAGNLGVGGSEVINSAPVAVNDAFTVNEDTVLVASVFANDTDVNNNTLTVTTFSVNGVTYQAGDTATLAEGTLVLNADGGLTFTPATNWSGNFPSVSYTVTDGQGGVSSASLNISVTPVADAPVLDVVNNVVSLTPSSFTITTGANGTLADLGMSQANIEAELGLAAGFLDTFAPTGGPITDPGSIDAVDGNFSSSFYRLEANSTIRFSWNFINGEDTTGEIQSGYNDFVLMIITAPDGTKTVKLITASELLGASVNGSGVESFTATQDGVYKVDFVILNGLDAGKDSRFTVNNTQVVIDGQSYGLPVVLNIDAAVTDSSETLIVNISGLPSGSLLSAGTQNADGSWSVTQAELDGIMFYPPSGFAGNIALSVSATSFDGTDSATVTETINISVNVTANTVSSGTAAADTINGSTNSDFIMGYAGNDVINGGAGNDILNGGSGADRLNGGIGNDVLIGGQGNDILTGGLGADVFAWHLGEQGTASAVSVDRITDFNLNQGDVLDLADLLQGESVDTIAQYLSFNFADGNTTISIKHDATGGVTQQIVLEGVDLTALGSDAQTIIDSLINNGNLKIDG
ncbi:MAG: type I secretion C-terminal target domain-containing protein, partial [Gammaproteobacteria bacterium]|nr:type I secretion C-terminal target domain-containing protein [Gammaproteobacteria bacterium]